MQNLFLILNVIYGEVIDNNVSTFIGDFIFRYEKFKRKSKIYVNVKPHQLSLDSHGDNFKIIDKEFLEGTQLFVIREVDTGIELNIKGPRIR